MDAKFRGYCYDALYTARVSKDTNQLEARHIKVRKETALKAAETPAR